MEDSSSSLISEEDYFMVAKEKLDKEKEEKEAEIINKIENPPCQVVALSITVRVILIIFLASCKITMFFLLYVTGCTVLNNAVYSPLFQFSTALAKNTLTSKILGPIVAITDFGISYATAVLCWIIKGLLGNILSTIGPEMSYIWDNFSITKNVSAKDVCKNLLHTLTQILLFIIIIIFYACMLAFIGNEFGQAIHIFTCIALLGLFFVMRLKIVKEYINANAVFKTGRRRHRRKNLAQQEGNVENQEEARPEVKQEEEFPQDDNDTPPQDPENPDDKDKPKPPPPELKQQPLTLTAVIKKLYLKSEICPDFNMLSTDYSDSAYPSIQKYIKWAIIVFIYGIHLGYLIDSYTELPLSSIMSPFLLLLAVDMNVIDLAINLKRTLSRVGDSFILVFYGVLIYYGLLLFMYFCGLIYISTKKQPYFPVLRYIEDKDNWFKFASQETNTANPSFCRFSSMSDDIYTTTDFIMMTTLPRLYALNDKHKCYIKPNMRGIFNSTMKYIFGKDYESQGIEIYCSPASESSSPYLIISSDKLLYNNIAKLSNSPGFFYTSDDYNKTRQHPYFDAKNLSRSKSSEKEREILMECIEKNTTHCEDEWQNYTNMYWTDFGEKDLRLKGLEPYELTITPDSNAFRRRGFYNNLNISGTHFVVGGCFEDFWGYSYLVELMVLKYAPVLFNNVIPFYAMVNNLFSPFFRGIDRSNSGSMLITRAAGRDVNEVNRIMSSFTINKTMTFGIGHSISGATIKAALYAGEFPGVAFNTISSLYLNIKGFGSNTNTWSNFLNVFDEGSFLSEFDTQVHENGELASVFYNPNVFDTACLTAITCSETRKYVPFCKQVLTQKKISPEEEFERIFLAYLKKRDITNVVQFTA